jgi:hypothetical protein
MAIPAAGSVSMSQINTEYGRGNNLNAYRGTTYYTSSAGPFTFPAGTISMNNFRGTQANSPVTISLASLQSKALFSYVVTGDLPASVELFFSPLGFWISTDDALSSGDWASPNASGRGASYWLSWTRTATAGGTGTATASSGYVGLSTGRSIIVQQNSNPGTDYWQAQYSFSISSSSSGSPVVASCTNVVMTVINV